MEIFSLGAEKSVLSAIMMDNTAIEEINLSEDDFYHQIHRVVFIAMKELYEANVPIDIQTLGDKITKMGKLDDIGGLITLLDINGYMPTAANVKHHADIIRKDSLRRKFFQLAKEMEVRSEECEEIMPLIEEAQEKIIKLTDTTSQKNATSCKEAVERYVELIKECKDGQAKGIITDFFDVNEKLRGGFKKGELIILAARPAMGKTAFAMNVAYSVSKDKNVLFFSLEMSEEQLMQRLFKATAHLYRRHIAEQKMDEERARSAIAATLSKKNLYIYDNSRVTLTDIRRVARQVRHKHGGLELIVIDYLQLITSEKVRKNESKANEVGEITRSLKILAREMEIPIIVLSQLNRGVESRDDKRPLMSDLRDSGSIEQDADVVMFLYRDDYYNPNQGKEKEAELIISKNRMGGVGGVKLYFDAEATYFGNSPTRRM